MEQRKKKPAGDNRLAVLGGVTVLQLRNSIILHEPSDTGAQYTTARTFPFPLASLTAAPGLSVGHKDAPSADILAALNLSNSPPVAWTPPPPPRPRPTGSVETLPPVSPFAASIYLKGIQTPSGSSIQYQRDDGLSGHHWRSDTKRRNPGVTGDGWQCRRFDPADPLAAAAICLAEGEKDAAILATAGLIAFTAPTRCPELALGRLHRASGPGQGNRPPGVLSW